MNKDQIIRFVKPSRNQDWDKGDMGIIASVLATRPQNQFDLYKVRLATGSHVWATHEDIEPFNQMSLFDGI